MYGVVLGWSFSDGSFKYNVDVFNIVVDKIKLLNGWYFVYVEYGVSKVDVKYNVLFVYGFMLFWFLGMLFLGFFFVMLCLLFVVIY